MLTLLFETRSRGSIPAISSATLKSCDLYRLSKGPAEIAKLFGAVADPPGNAGESVYPGYPGATSSQKAAFARWPGASRSP